MTVMAGCAGTAKGPTDEELIAQAVEGWKAAGIAQDVDKLMSFYSEKFTNYEWGDKAGAKKFVQDAKDMGYLKDAQLDSSGAKTEIDKKKGEAKVYPIEMKAAFGSATIELIFKKEGAQWMITGMDVQQY